MAVCENLLSSLSLRLSSFWGGLDIWAEIWLGILAHPPPALQWSSHIYLKMLYFLHTFTSAMSCTFLPSHPILFLVKALVSSSGSDIALIQDIEPSNARTWLSHATLWFLAWLSSATLKIFISGVSSQILMP